MDFQRLRQAFQEPGNLVGLAASVAASAALLNPLPLLVGVVAETAYLLFAPDSKWYDSRLSQRAAAARQRQWEQFKQQTLPMLRADTQERFRCLEQMRRQIEMQSEE